eukprot:CAMPEP_0116008794 /NCGR_PEP_ID=MMETSP0321-20121206/3064_1 /TAXON_ID=163516 /ORGANISM="Leptocylindrus danicus var. danicus, Strain B650" /LENGTH=442 /DNA_ID=CAMNT_0003477663 /DNA_START=102 /DNA_END=1431 /DNA_ORIENTATION=+
MEDLEQYREALLVFEKTKKCVTSPICRQRKSKHYFAIDDRTEQTSSGASQEESQENPDAAVFNKNPEHDGWTNSMGETREQLNTKKGYKRMGNWRIQHENDCRYHSVRLFVPPKSSEKTHRVNYPDKEERPRATGAFILPSSKPSGNKTNQNASNDSPVYVDEDPTIDDISATLELETVELFNNENTRAGDVENKIHHSNDEYISAVLEKFDLSILASNLTKRHHDGAPCSHIPNNECERNYQTQDLANSPVRKHEAKAKQLKQTSHKVSITKNENTIFKQRNEVSPSPSHRELSAIDELGHRPAKPHVRFETKTKQQSYISRKLLKLAETLKRADGESDAIRETCKGRRARLRREADAATLIQAAYRGKVCRRRKVGAILVTLATLMRCDAKTRICQLKMNDILSVWFDIRFDGEGCVEEFIIELKKQFIHSDDDNGTESS